VRPFTPYYGRCSLAMGGSHGFRSTRRDKRAFHTRFPSGSGCHCLNRATPGNSSGHTPKGTRSPGPPKRPSGSHCMDAVGFRLSFTPLAGVLFTVPSRYCALSVTTSSQPWGVVAPASHAISRVAWYLSWDSWRARSTSTGLSPALVRRSSRFGVLSVSQWPGVSPAPIGSQPPSRNA
jgi:hypothetical protein